MKTTYHGSCHCKAVTYEADIDFSQGTAKCNCTLCWKQRMWKARVDPSDFRLLSGEDGRTFCSQCGIFTHEHGNLEQLGGAFTMIYVASLDDLPIETLLAAPVMYQDGLHDNWQNRPAETRHL